MKLMTASTDYNAVYDFVDKNVVRGFENKPAFIDPSQTLTYGELHKSTNRMGNSRCPSDV
jgi:acyl-coenzyme A synthetase/AMP-(fatty) acid ligase